LVAAYGFDESSGSTVTDASGNANTGTITAATRTLSGKYGSALSFNGTSARVTVPDSASLDLTNAMTIEAWVLPSVAPTDWRAVIAKDVDRYYLMAGTNDQNRPGVGGTFGTTNQNVTGWTAWGRQNSNPQFQDPFVINGRINVTRLFGRHSVKMGYEYQAINTEIDDFNPKYGNDTYSGQFSRPTTAAANPAIYNLADFMFGARNQ
jgi:hypothetical protein